MPPSPKGPMWLCRVLTDWPESKFLASKLLLPSLHECIRSSHYVVLFSRERLSVHSGVLSVLVCSYAEGLRERTFCLYCHNIDQQAYSREKGACA